MKDMKLGQKMRWVAGVLYGVLAVVLMLSMRFFLTVDNGSGMMITNMTAGWLLMLGVMLLAAVMAVWMLSGRDFLSGNVQRGVVAGTVMVVAFWLVGYNSMAEAIRMTLTVTFGMAYESSIWELVLIVVQLVLMILAAFFVTSAHERVGGAEDAIEAGEDAGLEVTATDTSVEVLVDTDGDVVAETVVETTILTKAEDEEESKEKDD